MQFQLNRWCHKSWRVCSGNWNRRAELIVYLVLGWSLV